MHEYQVFFFNPAKHYLDHTNETPTRSWNKALDLARENASAMPGSEIYISRQGKVIYTVLNVQGNFMEVDHESNAVTSFRNSALNYE